MGTRDNNGVQSNVTHNAGVGSVERGGGQAGQEADSWNGGKNLHGKRTGTEEDMSKVRSSQGCQIQAGPGKEKDMGGVGDYGQNADEHKKGFFGTTH